MNFVMLGHSCAGKTTYMAALYKEMSKGVYDYSIRYDIMSNYLYKKNILHNQCFTLSEAKKEEEELRIISDNICKGIYPPPTAIKQEYIFKLKYKNFNDIEFNWFDYRGGALMEHSDQNSDIVFLSEKIKTSDALFVFLDGKQLEEPLQQNKRQYKRMAYLIKKTISSVPVAPGKYYPISFIITKNDLCSDVYNSSGLDFFYDNILCDISESSRIAGLITCVSINKTNICNVHWPLFFSINHCMHKIANEVVSSYNNRGNNRGFISSLKEWLTDDDRYITNGIITQLQKSKNVLGEILKQGNNKQFYYI